MPTLTLSSTPAFSVSPPTRDLGSGIDFKLNDVKVNYTTVVERA